MARQPIGNARKTRVNIRSGCQVKEWLKFRWDHCERRYKYARSLICRRTRFVHELEATMTNATWRVDSMDRLLLKRELNSAENAFSLSLSLCTKKKI